MKVKTLVAQLKKLDPELHVYLSDDNELNGIHDCQQPEVMLVDEEQCLYSPGEEPEDLLLQKIVVL